MLIIAGTLRIFHVCPERVQADLSPKCFRERDPVGHASRDLHRRRHGNRDGIDDSDHLRLMVSQITRLILTKRSSNCLSFVGPCAPTWCMSFCSPSF